MEALTVEEVMSVLGKEGIPSEAIDSLAENCVDGATLVALVQDFEEFKHVVPKAGIRMKLKSFVRKFQDSQETADDNLELDEASFSASTSINLSIDESPPAVETSTPKTLPATPKFRPVATPPKPDPTPPKIKQESLPVTPGLSSWAYDLEIPTRYSIETMQCFEDGVLTSKARNEIIDSLSTIMMLHTMNPSTDEYIIVSQRLIQTIPCLKDSIGSGHASWKKKLINKFKNMRRPKRSAKLGLPVPEPPSKKSNSVSFSASDTAEYDRHVQRIQKSYSGGKWLASQMTTLLELTFPIRRKWIVDEKPRVSEIIQKFPCLQEPSLLLEEFKRIAGLTEDKFLSNWEELQVKIMKYAARDSKAAVKALSAQYSKREITKDRMTTYSLSVLSELLSIKGKTKGSIYIQNLGEVIDLEEEIENVEHPHPVIVAFGQNIDELMEFRVVVEGNVFLAKDMNSAVHTCFASYWVFDMEYPSTVKSILLLLENMVYKIPRSQSLSTTYCSHYN